ASLAEIFWIRGRMNEERQDFAKAIEWLTKALAEPVESDSFRHKVMWYLAWNERKIHNREAAVGLLEKLKETTENNYDRNRYQYWLGKTLTEIGEAKKARE